jgi:hypothetical protein
MISKEDILKKGSVEVHIKVGGIRQRHTLKVEKEKTAWGMVPFCVFSHPVPASELVRVSQEIDLPVKCKGMKVFPKGKGAKDFAEKEQEDSEGEEADESDDEEENVDEPEEEQEKTEEGSSAQNQKAVESESTEEKPKKKFLSRVLSEGILS